MTKQRRTQTVLDNNEKSISTLLVDKVNSEILGHQINKKPENIKQENLENETTLINLEEIISKEVINLSSGENLGYVGNAIIKNNKIDKLLIFNDEESDFLLPAKNVFDFGDALTIKHNLDIENAENFSSTQIIGARVFKQDGSFLGVINKLLFDATKLTITSFDVKKSTSIVDDINETFDVKNDGSILTFDFKEVSSLTDGICTLKGDKKIVLPKLTTHTNKIKTTSRTKPQHLRASQIQSPASFNNSSFDNNYIKNSPKEILNSLNNIILENEKALNEISNKNNEEFTTSLYDVNYVTSPINGTLNFNSHITKVDDNKNNIALIDGFNNQKINSKSFIINDEITLPEKLILNHEFLLGRHLTASIYLSTGETLAERNELITKKLIVSSLMNGKVSELIKLSCI